MGVMLMAITFLDPVVGLSGLLAVLVSNLWAWWLGFPKSYIKLGSYAFNSLLVGLGLSIFYEPNIQFFILLIISTLITFLLTVTISGVLGKYGLPYLSIPFLLALWSLLLASRQFEVLGISERGVFFLNELFQKGSHWLVSLYHKFNAYPIHESIKVYLKSLGAILFQFNIVSGMVVAIGLFIYSRIAFVLSILSFGTAYWFYQFIGADITELSYSYIGFNFILSGIAIGGFYLIPSWRSYMWTMLMVPPLVVLTSSLSTLFSFVQLGIYSLPFNAVVIPFLYMLKLRSSGKEPQETGLQLMQPEKNLYEFQAHPEAYPNFQGIEIGLPVLGNWWISQGPNGSLTHREEWQNAWDLVIVDEEGQQFKNDGDVLTDYFCYERPVVAPAAGTVVELVDYVEDNPVGDTNLTRNWGNSIVLQHGEQLYSQISHIKQGSFKVKKGEVVEKGQMLATCGNSGRSPYPHVHFQVQRTPQIGSKTLAFPLSHYWVQRNGQKELKCFDFPNENDTVSSIAGNTLLKNALHLLPGQKLKFFVQDGVKESTVQWEVQVDPHNRTYLRCLQSGAQAYFRNDGTLFYFTHYDGKKNTLLYYFYLGAFKLIQAYHPQAKLKDTYPLYVFGFSWKRLFQDFLAPFYRFMFARYEVYQLQADDDLDPDTIEIRSQTRLMVADKVLKQYDFEFLISQQGISEFRVESEQLKIMASHV